MQIIDIAGVQLVVSDKDYDYYWSQKNIGENSDAFKVACRRLLGLGPDSHSFNSNFTQLHVWGDNNKDQCIQKILKSGLIEYEEEWYKNQPSSQLKDAAYTAQCEQALMQGFNPKRTRHNLVFNDDEFEDEFTLGE